MSADDRYVVEDPRFRGEREAPEMEVAPEQPRRRRSCLASCALGCLGVGVVLLVVVAIVVYWLVNNWRDVLANVGAEALRHTINATELPEAEKQEIGVQIDRVAAAMREGRINQQQMEAIFQRILQSPVLPLIAASAIESKYIARSGLNEQEKAEARQTLRRYLRGAIDHKINDQQINAALAHVADRQKDGSWRLRNQVSDEDLRAFLKEASEQADGAGIPAEPEDVDPSEEFKRIIDEAMGEPVAEAVDEPVNAEIDEPLVERPEP